MKVLFSILLLLAVSQTFSITQEKLFTTERQNTYYIEVKQRYDWFQSMAKCEQMNMALVAFDSKVKWNDVLSMMKNEFGKPVVLWTSGYAVGEHHQFTWMTTGEEFTFTFWTVRNPDFDRRREYCVHIGYGPNMEWNDNMCTRKFGFICEYKEGENSDRQK